MMTKSNWAEQLEQTIQTWISEGRSEEQIYGVRNFFTGVGTKFISNLLIQEREAGGCTCGFGKDTAAEIGHFKECPRFPEETWWQTKARIRTETIKEVIEKIDKTFETGHGGGNWRRLVEQLKGELEKL